MKKGHVFVARPLDPRTLECLRDGANVPGFCRPRVAILSTWASGFRILVTGRLLQPVENEKYLGILVCLDNNGVRAYRGNGREWRGVEQYVGF